MLRNTFVYCSFGYYSKDLNLKLIERVFDSIQKEFIIKDDSDNFDSKPSIAYKKYQELQEAVLRQILNDNINSIVTAPPLEEFFDLCLQLGFEPPNSYVDFLATCNGYRTTHDDKDIHFFSIDELKQQNINHIFQEKSLLIGYSDDCPVEIDFSDPDNTIFKWYENTYRSGARQGSASSFYGVIEYFFLSSTE